MQPFQSRGAILDQASMILREIADGSLVSPDNLTGVDEWSVVAACLTKFRIRSRRRIRQQGIHQRGLARPVTSHERDLLAAGNARSEVANDLFLTVRFGEMFDLEDVLARGTLLFELNVWPLDVGLRQFRDLQAFDFLAPRLYLA